MGSCHSTTKVQENAQAVHSETVPQKSKHPSNEKSLRAESVDVSLKPHNETSVFGVHLPTEKTVRVRVGPVIGQVTSTTAIIMLEVSCKAPVSVHLVADSRSPVSQTQLMPSNKPKAFFIENLQPNTEYNVCFGGVRASDARLRTGYLRTLPLDCSAKQLSIAAVSCDRPERYFEFQTNMWQKLAEQVRSKQVDLVLHLGDQVYGQKEFCDAWSILRQYDLSSMDQKHKEKVFEKVRDRLRDIYRYTWNLPHTAYVLAHCAHSMIWSDNDIYNDFTIARVNGKELEPKMLVLAQQVYREYQRQLWDVDYAKKNGVTTDEFFYQKLGSSVVFMIDMRGNHLSLSGDPEPERPIMNEAQWSLLQSVLAMDDVTSLLVCSEIPFVGDSPEEAKKKSLQEGMEFLVDHWAYQTEELVRLLTLLSDWKKDGIAKGISREVVMAGGDIHAGVTSTIADSTNGVTIKHITTSPISNHTCAFFPALTGSVDSRFSYQHTPLNKQRNYGMFKMQATSKGAVVDAYLVVDEKVYPSHH
eukprot:GILJ01002015.1.p1 GENE.GILJ01002015.1~~GILJ01002015.1.p1  ORF type:complete len:541 (-),score=74.39 GILJ01002015.1:115-1698(-)